MTVEHTTRPYGFAVIALNEENEFQYFHSYMRLASEGKVSALTCECGTGYITMLRNGELNLWCPFDDTYMVPGEKLRLFVEQKVDELETYE